MTTEEIEEASPLYIADKALDFQLTRYPDFERAPNQPKWHCFISFGHCAATAYGEVPAEAIRNAAMAAIGKGE